MARVTVEDCVTIIPNRFELVLLASQRARDIAAGVALTIDRDNDKNAVVSLREIAEQTVDFEELRRHIVRGVNRHADLNLEDDKLLSLTQELAGDLHNFQGAAEIEEVDFQSDEAVTDTDEDDSDDETTDEPSLDDLSNVFADAEESDDDIIV